MLSERTFGLARPGRHGPVLARLRRIARGAEPGVTAVDGARLVLDLLDRGVVVEALFTTPEHVQKARAEFDKRRGSFTYKAQIGDRKPPLDYRK